MRHPRPERYRKTNVVRANARLKSRVNNNSAKRRSETRPRAAPPKRRPPKPPRARPRPPKPRLGLNRLNPRSPNPLSRRPRRRLRPSHPRPRQRQRLKRRNKQSHDRVRRRRRSVVHRRPPVRKPSGYRDRPEPTNRVGIDATTARAPRPTVQSGRRAALPSTNALRGLVRRRLNPRRARARIGPAAAGVSVRPVREKPCAIQRSRRSLLATEARAPAALAADLVGRLPRRTLRRTFSAPLARRPGPERPTWIAVPISMRRTPLAAARRGQARPSRGPVANRAAARVASRSALLRVTTKGPSNASDRSPPSGAPENVSGRSARSARRKPLVARVRWSFRT